MKILFTLSILLALHNQITAHDKHKNPAYKTLDPRKGNEPKPLDKSSHAPKRIGSYDLVPTSDTPTSPQTSQKTFATQTTLKDTSEETTYERIPALKPNEPLYIPATSSADESETFKNKKPSVAAVASVAAARKRTTSISQQSASYPSLPQSQSQPIAVPYPPYNPQQASSYPPQQPYYPCHGYPSAPDIPSYQPGYQPIPYSVAPYPQNYPAFPILQPQPVVYSEHHNSSGSFSRRSSSNSLSSERQQNSDHRRQRSSSDPSLAISIGALSLDEQSTDPLQRLAAKKEDAVRSTLEQLKKQLQTIQERITDINARDYADAPHKKSVLQKIGLSKTDLEQQQKNRDTEIARLQQEKIKIVEKIEKIQTTLTK